MGKANWYFNTRDRQWELRDAAGNVSFIGNNAGIAVPSLATIQALRTAGVASLADARITRALIGGGGTISLMTKLSGTLPAVTAVGSGAVTTVTMTNMGSAGIAVGDMVFVVPKAALGGHTAIVNPFIPTTNVVNVNILNTKPDSAGSFVAVGVDAYFIRSA